MICLPSAVNKCPFKRTYYSIFSKECLVFGNIICCPFRMKCLALYTVPLALIQGTLPLHRAHSHHTGHTPTIQGTLPLYRAHSHYTGHSPTTQGTLSLPGPRKLLQEALHASPVRWQEGPMYMVYIVYSVQCTI